MKPSISQISQWVDTGLLIAFIAVLATTAIAFLRGMLRGWKHGTFRFFFMLLFAGIPLALLPIEANALGSLPLGDWIGPSKEITINGTTFIWETGNLNVSVFNFIYKLLTDVYHVSGTPQDIANYAIALTGSVLRLLMIFVIAFVTLTVGALLSLLLWHIAFKHIVPKRKRRPSKRWISGLEEMVVYFGLLAMCVVPFSGLANSLRHGTDGSRSEDNTNETISLINAVLNSYENSIFNKAFFAWTAGDGSKTLDTQLAEFIASNSYLDSNTQTVYYANIVKEINIIASVAQDLSSLLVTPNGSQSMTGSILNSSLLIGGSLYSLARNDSRIVAADFAPLTYDLSANINLVKEALGPNQSAALANSYAAGALSPLAASYSYAKVASADLISTIPCPEFDNLAMPAYSRGLDEFSDLSVARLRAHNEVNYEDRNLVNALVAGYVHAYYEADPGLDSSAESLTLLSMLPRNADGSLDEVAFAQIDWCKEADVFYDVENSLKALSPKMADSDRSQSDMDKLLKDFLNAVVDNADFVIETLVGTREAGVPKTKSRGENVSKYCLLDSDLVSYVLPGVLEIVGYYLDENVLIEEKDHKVQEPIANLAVSLKGENLFQSRVNFKGELGHILDVVGKLTVNQAGREFLKNYEKHPGVEQAEDGTLLHVQPELAIALQAGLKNMDYSRLLLLVGPEIGDHFVRPMLEEEGSLHEMGIQHL